MIKRNQKGSVSVISSKPPLSVYVPIKPCVLSKDKWDILVLLAYSWFFHSGVSFKIDGKIYATEKKKEIVKIKHLSSSRFEECPCG